MKIFFGAAIQGNVNREERAFFHQSLMQCIRDECYEVVSEHTMGKSIEETAKLLEKSIGPLPPPGIQRRIYVRRKMIEAVEGDIVGAIFEVSIPSLGTGIEIAHAYLRPRIGLKAIPVLVLYQKEFWPGHLSTMIQGITREEVPHFHLKEYTNLDEAENLVKKFLREIGKSLEK